jgi:mannose-6-phosphate isomerase-like protein (cupin superfamily)
MTAPIAPHIRAAQILLPCPDLAAELKFFTEQLGFKVAQIMPADAPALAVINGHGVTLRLEARKRAHKDGDNQTPLTLRLLCDGIAEPRELIAPGGTRIELVAAQNAIEVPRGTNEFVLTRMTEDWGTGRAGMQYRDLVPSRLGGRFIASHIRIPQGGPVPDYVHFHKIRFQMIFCKAGWTRLVYEDQGDEFILAAGDCVLQPPEIRHRVLEASAGLEVIEIGCPAVHETFADQLLALPTGRDLPDRDFGNRDLGWQRFVRHVAKDAAWEKWATLASSPNSNQGFEARDIGIGAATDGLAGARVVRARNRAATKQVSHGGEFNFLFVLQGALDLRHTQFGQHQLGAGDCCVLPAGAPYTLSAEAGLEMLEVTLPATLPEA